jgi:hypothetical protein
VAMSHRLGSATRPFMTGSDPHRTIDSDGCVANSVCVKM